MYSVRVAPPEVVRREAPAAVGGISIEFPMASNRREGWLTPRKEFPGRK